MRILLISTSYPLVRNGSEAAGSFVEDFALELSAQGNEVSVVFPVSEDVQPATASCKEPTYFPFKVPSVPLSTLSLGSPSDWFRIVSTLIAGDRSVKNAVDVFEPDFVLALWALPSGYWALRHCKRPGISYGTWALGSDIWSLGKIPIVKSLLVKTLNRSYVNFADGYELARNVEELCGRNCKFLPSTRLLPEASREALRGEPPFRLTYIGRWHQNKGIDILLDALEQLDESDWDAIASIQIAGGGPLAYEVEEKTSSLISQGRPVTLTGYVDKNEVSVMLSKTDYLLIPSRIESIPVVFSDSMQAGCPVIATPVGDIPELVRKYSCGVVADTATVDDYAVALSNALSRSAKEFENGVKTAAKAFSLQDIIKNLVRLIQT